MFGLIKTWKALEAKGIMGINRRNADYVLKYNKRHLYPIVDDKIITKERAIEAGINVPEMYGVISTEKEIKVNEFQTDAVLLNYGNNFIRISNLLRNREWNEFENKKEILEEIQTTTRLIREYLYQQIIKHEQFGNDEEDQ